MTEYSVGHQEFFDMQIEIQTLFSRAFEMLVASEGITLAQALTLKTLRDQGKGEPCKMSDLAGMRLLTPPAATGVVDRLIRLKFVERKDDESDRRVVLLTLTSTGEKTLSKIESKAQTIMRDFFERFSKADREAFFRIMMQLRENMKVLLEQMKKETNVRKKKESRAQVVLRRPSKRELERKGVWAFTSS